MVFSKQYAVFVSCGDIDRELQEIAENLHRNELTALERDTQIARWVELVAAKVSDKLSETSSSDKGGRPGKASATARDLLARRLAQRLPEYALN